MSADALILIHFSKRRDEGKEKKSPRRDIGGFYADVKVHSSGGKQLSGEEKKKLIYSSSSFLLPPQHTGVMRR